VGEVAGRIRTPTPFVFFRSLREKLVVLIILLSLVPLAGLAAFSYYIGSYYITGRVELLLNKMALDTADKLDFVLTEKKDEVRLMATTFPLISKSVAGRRSDGITDLLNTYCFNHDVYDLLIVLDARGMIVGINTADRYTVPLPQDRLARIKKGSIAAYPEEYRLYQAAMRGQAAHHEWYRSQMVRELYNYDKEDIAQQYNIALAEPLHDPVSHEIVGVWINVLNWSYFQGILDAVEGDLRNLALNTGYAFLLNRDEDTIIGHKYRLNRPPDDSGGPRAASVPSLYSTRLVEDHGLVDLYNGVRRRQRSFSYEFPRGSRKISGIAPIEDLSFGWVVCVSLDADEVFQPVRKLTWWLLAATALLSVLVVASTFAVASGITVPLKNLISTARTIARGKFDERVQIRSSDEVGILGSTFNDMARALSTREGQLQELNRNLEDMVRQRTIELESSHDALKRAYVDLQNAQQQLVQSEKMASLGQLVAGIAHEIKNPLNFIYGNTGFLANYIAKLQTLVDAYEKLPSLSEVDLAAIQELREEINYDFIQEDLRTLIDNFTEGARRINNIVSDLRTFSRMDADEVSEVDIHASIEMSLNLLRNQYKDRVEIHREYGEIPRIQGYSGKLNQVFMNLLSNAFHAVREKGDVWIRTRASDGAVEVEIEDNGSGIAREHMNRIFEPFFTTKPVGQGTGLGLSISYGIIEQHRGRIRVTSAPEKGSLFTVRLPVFRDKVGE
jgi:signal transduction histidine kinase